MDNTTNSYIIAGGETGAYRLSKLSEILRPTTSALLARSGLSQGDHVADLGCGGGDVAIEMSRIVGPAGSVDGFDLDSETIRIAQDHARDLGLSQVRFFEADVNNWEAPKAYDLIYMRFILSHLRDPMALIARAILGLSKGGRLVIEDTEFRGHFSEPSCSAFDKYVQLYTDALASRGEDANVGPRLYAMIQEAGAHVEHVGVVQPIQRHDAPFNMALETLKRVEPSLVPSQISPEEFRRLQSELAEFIQQKHMLTALPRIFQYVAVKR